MHNFIITNMLKVMNERHKNIQFYEQFGYDKCLYLKVAHVITR